MSSRIAYPTSTLAEESIKYNDQYMEKDRAMIQNQIFSIRDIPELADIKSLAEFYRYLFKEFTCTKDDVVRIKYRLFSLEELDEDLDYDEMHYTRISNEFERILSLYVRELCIRLSTDVEVYDKNDFKRLYEYTNNGRLKYSESFMT